MKKSLVMCGVVALALASCTQNEVLEVNDSRAIGFDAFVNKTTRAVNDLKGENFTKFFVFGDYNNGGSVAYSNTPVNGSGVGDESTWTPENLAYWMPGQTYTFGAYANGATASDAKLSNVQFANGSMTISEYTVSDKDLVAAVTNNISAPEGGTDQSVELSFKHLLSKIKFTFSTEAEPAAYKMKVSGLTISNAMKENTSVIVGESGITTVWAGELGGTYTVADLEDFAVAAEGGNKASTEENYIIPQSNEKLNATFTVTVYDQKSGTEIATGNFTAPLKTGDGNTWTNGFVYNYTAKINPNQVDPEKPFKPINFTVDAVEGWQPDTNVPTTPQP